MDAQELRPGLWRWTAAHPDWTPDEGGPDGWEQEVASYAYVADETLVLVDPLVPDDDRFWRELDRDVERVGPPHVLLTVFWHARSAQAILDRHEGARVWAHEAAVERIGERTRITDTFDTGATLPGGIEPRPIQRADEVLYWLPAHRALFAGDSLLGAHGGGIRLCPPSWFREAADYEPFRRSLRPLLELPIELVLLTHGEPVLENGRDALARALDDA